MHNAEFKAKWLQALRSGEFKQCTTRLECDGAYCALGLLAHVNGINTLDAYEFSNNVLGVNLSYEIQSMNDGNEGYKKHSFSEIADYVEVKA